MQESGTQNKSYPELQSFLLTYLLLISTYDTCCECPDYQPHNQTQRSIHLHLQSPSLLMHPVNPDCSIYSQLQAHCHRKAD